MVTDWRKCSRRQLCGALWGCAGGVTLSMVSVWSRKIGISAASGFQTSDISGVLAPLPPPPLPLPPGTRKIGGGLAKLRRGEGRCGKR